MGWFDWLKRDELRRIHGLREQLHDRRVLLDATERELELTRELLHTVVAHVNVRMQAGEPWAEVYNGVIEKLGEKSQIAVRQVTLEMMHKLQMEGRNLNMIQDPVFEFPESYRITLPSGTEVTMHAQTEKELDWWNQHSGR